MGVGANMRTFHAVPIKCWYQSFRQIRWTTRSCVALLSTALCSAQSSGPRLMRSDAPIEWQRFGGCRHRWTAARSDSKNERHGMEFLYEFGDVDVLIVETGFQRFHFFSWERSSKILGTILKITWFQLNFRWVSTLGWCFWVFCPVEASGSSG